MSTRGTTNPATGGRERPARVTPTGANRSASSQNRAAGLRTLATNLRAAEDRIAGLPTEEAHAFAPDGRELLSRTGEAVREEGLRGQGTYFKPDELARMRGAVVTHNHPMGNTLSRADVAMAMKHDFAQIRAVTPDRVYVLSVPKTGWGRWDGPQGASATWDYIHARLVPAWRDEVLSGRMSQAEAERNVTEGILRTFADTTGLRYRVISRRGGGSRQHAA